MARVKALESVAQITHRGQSLVVWARHNNFNFLINECWSRVHLQPIWGKRKTGSTVRIPEGCVGMQKVLSSLEKWADKNTLKFQKCSVLHLGRNNSIHTWVGLQLESSMAEVALRVLVVTKTTTIEQGVLAARKQISLWADLEGMLSAFLSFKSSIHGFTPF